MPISLRIRALPPLEFLSPARHFGRGVPPNSAAPDRFRAASASARNLPCIRQLLRYFGFVWKWEYHEYVVPVHATLSFSEALTAFFMRAISRIFTKHGLLAAFPSRTTAGIFPAGLRTNVLFDPICTHPRSPLDETHRHG